MNLSPNIYCHNSLYVTNHSTYKYMWCIEIISSVKCMTGTVSDYPIAKCPPFYFELTRLNVFLADFFCAIYSKLSITESGWIFEHSFLLNLKCNI